MAEGENLEGTVSLGIDTSNLDSGTKRAADNLVKQEKRMTDSAEKVAEKGTQAYDKLAAAKEKASARMTAQDKALIESEKRLTLETVADTKERIAVVQAELKTMEQAEARRKRSATTRQINLRNAGLMIQAGGRVDLVKSRTEGALALEEQRRESAERRLQLSKERIDYELKEREKTRVTRRESAERERILKQAAKTVADYEAAQARKNEKWNALRIAASAAGVTPSQQFFGQLNQGLALSAGRQQMQGLVNQGMSGSQAWQQMMNRATTRANAANAAYFGGQNPPPPPAGGRGFLGMGGAAGRIGGRILGGAASALGFGVAGFGAYGAVQVARAVVEATQVATAYDRQRVAAESLAGSQQKLNALLDAYSKSSGGAVDQVTTLSNVTRLLATGYAESVPQVERFVRATRGASIALGKPQDYVIQETQLAISNTSQKRLDQIGLSVEEVTNKIKELRKTNALWTRETAFQEAVLTIMDEKYGALTATMEGQVTGVEKLTTAWSNFMLTVGQTQQRDVNSISNWFSNIIAALDKQLVEGEARAKRNALWQFNLYKNSGLLAFDTMRSGGDITHAKAQGLQYMDSPTLTPSAAHGNFANAPAKPWSRPEEQMNVLVNAWQQEQDILAQANKARLQEVTQYEEQRASIIRNYGKNMVREEEDFQRQRARSQRDYDKSVADAIEDAAERDAEMQEDLDDRIAEAKENNAERISKIEEKYNEDREKAERKHRDNLLKAAGQLDAIAVLEERKRWREENKDRKDAHDEQLEEAKETLQEQIDDARKAHAERLEDARRADEKRLEDMRENREQQLADENEDREIRLARSKEDHDDQLDELDRQHDLRMEQIQKESDDQLKALQDALEGELAAVGIYVEGYLEKIKKRDEAVEKWFDNIITIMEDRIREELNPTTYRYDPATGPQIPTSYGQALLGTTSSTVTSGGTVVNQVGGGKTVNIQAGAITVFTTPGMELLVGNIVEEKMIELLDGVN